MIITISHLLLNTMTNIMMMSATMLEGNQCSNTAKHEQNANNYQRVHFERHFLYTNWRCISGISDWIAHGICKNSLTTAGFISFVTDSSKLSALSCLYVRNLTYSCPFGLIMSAVLILKAVHVYASKIVHHHSSIAAFNGCQILYSVFSWIGLSSTTTSSMRNTLTFNG